MVQTSDAPWDGSPSNWPDTGDGRTANFCRSCVINKNTGDPKKDWTQDKCKLPVFFPNGKLSTVSLSASAAALAGARTPMTGISASEKKAAANKLLGYYDQAKRNAPESLYKIAGKQPPSKPKYE